MKYKLLEKTEQYFDNEAKRIINIIYDENNQFGFDTKDMLKHSDVRIKEYYIHIELRMFGYNEAKKRLTKHIAGNNKPWDFSDFKYKNMQRGMDVILLCLHIKNNKINLCYVCIYPSF